MITKDGKDVPVQALTAENYIVPAGEERFYHCLIEVKQFNQRTGERMSRPRVQKFGRKAWSKGVYDNLLRQGYTVTVLHDPTGWWKQQAERKAMSHAKREAAKEAEIQAKVDAAVAKAIADLKAAEKAAKGAKKAKAEPKTETKEESK